MEKNAQAVVLASFIGDSLALGAHWIYDTSRIEKDYGRVETFLKPSQDSYHPTKERGEFTHYGDQAFILLMENILSWVIRTIVMILLHYHPLFRN